MEGRSDRAFEKIKGGRNDGEFVNEGKNGFPIVPFLLYIFVCACKGKGGLVVFPSILRILYIYL